MYLIIGIYGGKKRKIYAAYQFFLITLLGSLLMLMGIIMLYSQIGVTDYQIYTLTVELTKEREKIIWLALFISFAVKTPLVPVHIWLPEAHSEANIAGSIILAGVLLKLAGYGFLRYSLNILPEASRYYIPLVYGLSIISIIYCSLTTLRQIDMKKIIAYSSIGQNGPLNNNYLTQQTICRKFKEGKDSLLQNTKNVSNQRLKRDSFLVRIFVILLNNPQITKAQK